MARKPRPPDHDSSTGFDNISCFAGVAVAATVWWHQMPHGFPVTHARFWMNSVLGPAAFVACLSGFVAVVRKHDAVLKCLVLTFAVVPPVAGIAGKCMFPQSVSGLLLTFVCAYSALALLMVGLALWVLRRRTVTVWARAMCLFAGGIIGIFIPWSQRAPEAATKPCGQKDQAALTTLTGSDVRSLSLSNRITVTPGSGQVRLESGDVALDVHPLLSFTSCLPDRFWTVFAPPSTRVAPQRALVGLARSAKGVTLQYKGDGRARLEVSMVDVAQSVRIEALSHLPQAVYSHLNSFCVLQVSGPGSLALSFSPCPDIVEMKPSDYPVGRPARVAYVDVENVFHVVEADSGEKGPFTSLAKGKLRGNEPLRITVHNDKKPVFRISLHDWVEHASRQLSPTAGWGLPENAIQFTLRRGDESNEGIVFITLASTSVGRGWDSVGHAAGTYRNTMLIEPIPGAEQRAAVDADEPRR